MVKLKKVGNLKRIKMNYNEQRIKDLEEVAKPYGVFEVSEKDFDKLDDFINEVYSKGYDRGKKSLDK